MLGIIPADIVNQLIFNVEQKEVEDKKVGVE